MNNKYHFLSHRYNTDKPAIVTNPKGLSYTSEGNNLYDSLVALANKVAAYLQAATNSKIILPSRLPTAQATKPEKDLLILPYPGYQLSENPQPRQPNWPPSLLQQAAGSSSGTLYLQPMPRETSERPVPLDGGIPFAAPPTSVISPRQSTASSQLSASPVGSSSSQSLAQQLFPTPIPLDSRSGVSAMTGSINPTESIPVISTSKQLQSVQAKLDKVLANQSTLLQYSEVLINTSVPGRTTTLPPAQSLQVSTTTMAASTAAFNIDLTASPIVVTEKHIFDEYQDNKKLKRKAKEFEWENQKGNANKFFTSSFLINI